MKKLIELLNEYVEETDFGDNLNEYNEADIIDGETLEVNGNCHDIEYLYTKQFGFILWLVENDKIDIKKLIVKGEMRSGWDFENKKGDEEEGEEIWNRYWSELCLMLLAIQDEPINFLVSILK